MIQKGPKKSSHQKCFFAAKGLCAQAGKTAGWNLFAGLPYRFNTLHAKISYALSHFTGLLFFLLFPEAVLLTKNLILII
ncbi:MAG TPA: hypothetical protein VGN20_15365 [Mucilaginibacter sp.]